MCSNDLLLAANNGNATISVANSQLNGTGALVTVLTAGSSGTLVKSIIIKALGSTSLGMVRLFIGLAGSQPYLYKEVMVPAIDQTGVVPSFEYFVTIPFTLQTGYELLASTENAQNFNVLVNAVDWSNCECPA